MYIDTHTHLQFESYDEDRELVIQRAIENNVAAIITIGTDVTSSRQAVHLADKYASIFAAVGIHPNDCNDVSDRDYDEIKELAKHEKVAAIGEVGLDYHHMDAPKEVQDEAFTRQIQLAKEMQLPLIIHNRDSHEDLYNLLVRENAADAGGVLHSFTGNEKFLDNILKLDFYISFTGNITFKKSEAGLLVKKTPLERLLLETDSPFLTPVPLRGKRNEPAFVIHTAKKIAEMRELSEEELSKITTENADRLFKLKL